MTLSETEKGKLLDFIKSHYVDFHDLRLLIARDLEEDIVTRMREDEELTFDEALKEAYKEYGVIGFSDISEVYMKKIDKYFYKKVILKILKDEASTPKFWLLLILSFAVIHTILMSLMNSPFILAGGFLVLVIIAMIVFFRKFHREMKALKENDNFYYVHQLLASGNSIIFPISYTPLIIDPHVGRLAETEFWSMAILSAFATISVIGFYLMYFRVYKERHNILKNYKDNFLSKNVTTSFRLPKSNSEKILKAFKNN
jgi:hypothetical protein